MQIVAIKKSCNVTHIITWLRPPWKWHQNFADFFRWRYRWPYRIQSWLREQDGLQEHWWTRCRLRKVAQRNYFRISFNIFWHISSENNEKMSSCWEVFKKTHWGQKILILSEYSHFWQNSRFENLIFDKIHIFENLIFHKIHIFKV